MLFVVPRIETIPVPVTLDNPKILLWTICSGNWQQWGVCLQGYVGHCFAIDMLLESMYTTQPIRPGTKQFISCLKVKRCCSIETSLAPLVGGTSVSIQIQLAHKLGKPIRSIDPTCVVWNRRKLIHCQSLGPKYHTKATFT